MYPVQYRCTLYSTGVHYTVHLYTVQYRCILYSETHIAEGGVGVHSEPLVLGVSHPVVQHRAGAVEAEGEVARELGGVLHQVQPLRTLRQQLLDLDMMLCLDF